MTASKTTAQTSTENLTGIEMSRTVSAARRGDWKTQQLPDERGTLEINRSYPAAEAEMIRFGSIPRQMEDKWFIFYEDGKLFFHRSWTGLCVFVMYFCEKGDALVANRLDINEETADADSENLAFYLIEALLAQPPRRYAREPAGQSVERVGGHGASVGFCAPPGKAQKGFGEITRACMPAAT